MKPDWRRPVHVEELVAFDPAQIDTPPRPVRPRVCGALGPYIETRPGKHKDTYLSVKCTRPAGHPGNHQHAGPKGSTHEWTPAGEKVRPK